MEPYYILKAIDAALDAGNRIRAIYDYPDSDFQIERKADDSPLTIADRKAHEAIADALANTPFPLLSEEGKLMPYADRKGWQALWVVDPLDGTKEFIKRNGEFTVNIAWIRDGVPVMGVIYLPVKRILYFADEELGAYKVADMISREGRTLDQLRERAVRLPAADGHTSLVVVASRSHLTPETEAYIEELRQRRGAVELVSSGSSLKLCLVAEGVADVYPRFAPTMEWDTAAGHAIARAAGREMYQVGTDVPLRYNKENLLNPWFVVEPCRKNKSSNQVKNV